MKRLVKVLLMFATIAMIAGCIVAPTAVDISTSPLPSSIKGYELYSWPEGDDWNFTLITGTNRSKTLAEITSQDSLVDEDGWVKITVLGFEELKMILDNLPRSEQVLWLDGERLELLEESSIIAFPPGDVVEQVRQHSNQRGIKLIIIH